MSSDDASPAARAVDENRRLYRRWFEDVVSGGDISLVDELLGPGYRLHFPGIPEPLDAEAHKRLVMMFRSHFRTGSKRSTT